MNWIKWTALGIVAAAVAVPVIRSRMRCVVCGSDQSLDFKPRRGTQHPRPIY
jgi:hypothetical protein